MARPPIRNLVTPWGTLEGSLVHARGTFTGNRGALRNLEGVPSTSHRWITCTLERTTRRTLRPVRYTRLFFLDEAVALAAGHRPCAQCRPKAFEAYCASVRKTLASDIDAVLLSQRRSSRVSISRSRLAEMPDGVMVSGDDALALLLWQGTLWAWSHTGYTPAPSCAAQLIVLTPRQSVIALTRGYRVTPHPSLLLTAREQAGETDHRDLPKNVL